MVAQEGVPAAGPCSVAPSCFHLTLASRLPRRCWEEQKDGTRGKLAAPNHMRACLLCLVLVWDCIFFPLTLNLSGTIPAVP